MSLVGIALATYNSEKYIAQQLDSILEQSFSDWICYIHDDGSTDRTYEILEQYQKKYPDKFVLLDYKSQHSAKLNFMSILKHIKEPYVMCSDHDDYWLSNKIKITFQRMKLAESKQPNTGVLVFSDLKVVDAQLNVINESYARYTGYEPSEYLDLRKLLVKNVSNGCTMMMNKILFEKVCNCSNLNKIIMHDYWMILVAAATGMIEYIDKPLMLYRQHGDNVCGAIGEKSSLQRRYEDLIRIYRSSLRQYIREKRRWIVDRRAQASLLLDFGDIANQSEVEAFVKLGKKTWIARMLYYRKNHMFIKHQYTRLLFWG